MWEGTASTLSGQPPSDHVKTINLKLAYAMEMKVFFPFVMRQRFPKDNTRVSAIIWTICIYKYISGMNSYLRGMSSYV